MEPKKSGGVSWAWILGILVFLIAAGAVALPGLLTSNCVLEGEEVDVPGGRARIEDLRVGDVVTTRGSSGALETGRVVERRESTSSAWREIVVEGGGRLRVTAAHPVAVEEGWKSAGLLMAGDRILTRDGLRPIAEIREREGRARVFDLTVEPNPNFFASGVLVHNKSSPERNASTSLKTLASAQADFRGNDRDNNKVQDFWVGDVAGLYMITPAEGSEMIKLIELSIAGADDAPTCESARAWATVCVSAPKAGYLYRALLLYEDETGKKIPYDEGKGRNSSKFGFIAYPTGERAASRPTFILDEGNSVFKKHLKGERIDTFPRDLLKDGWSKLD